MMHSSARTGTAEAATIAAIETMTARALAAEVSLVEKALIKTTTPHELSVTAKIQSKATLPLTDLYNVSDKIMPFAKLTEVLLHPIGNKFQAIHARTVTPMRCQVTAGVVIGALVSNKVRQAYDDVW